MIELFKAKLLEKNGFNIHGFTQRTGGVSTDGFKSLNLAFDVGDSSEHVIENLERLKAKVNADASQTTLR